MIELFRQWFESHRFEFTQSKARLEVSHGTQGLLKNSIYADLRTGRFEWTAQLWETGEADFHFLDWENADAGVETIHYEFTTDKELISALNMMLKKIND